MTLKRKFTEADRDQNRPAKADVVASKPTETPQPQPVTTGQAVALSAPIDGPPPTSWSLESKAVWPTLPPHIREDIVAWEAAVDAEFRRCACTKPLFKLAAARGTTPEALLATWRTIEDVLRLDPDVGIRLILRRLANDRGIPPEQFRQWAASIMADVARAAAEHARMH